MPTYQYTCTDCAEQLEAVQSFADPALTECPACQGKLRKVFNSVGIVFKGSGFYRNDSRPGGATGAGNEKATETGDAAKKPDTSSNAAKTPESSTSKDSSSSSDSKSSATSSSTSGSSGASTATKPS